MNRLCFDLTFLQHSTMLLEKQSLQGNAEPHILNFLINSLLDHTVIQVLPLNPQRQNKVCCLVACPTSSNLITPGKVQQKNSLYIAWYQSKAAWRAFASKHVQSSKWTQSVFYTHFKTDKASKAQQQRSSKFSSAQTFHLLSSSDIG